jgi:hypothetical protein
MGLNAFALGQFPAQKGQERIHGNTKRDMAPPLHAIFHMRTHLLIEQSLDVTIQ